MSQTFIPMHTRYLSRKFFMDHYCDIIEVIDYYDLGKLVNWTNFVKIDRCAKFYNN